jgi:hypothetical protein
MSLKALAEKVLQGNRDGNFKETEVSRNVKNSGLKFPKECMDIDTIKGSEIETMRACPTCDARAFWLSVHGAVICGVCHPPASSALVKRWIGDPETLTRMKAAKPGVLLSFEDFKQRKVTQ